MTICFFGTYDPNYARNRIVRRGLESQGVTIVECHVEQGRGAWRQLVKKLRQQNGQFDMLLVPYTGETRWLVPLARLLSRKPIIWDAFYSAYDAWVYDRQLVSPWSPKALYYWAMDWINCQLSDRILLDTRQHIDYFVQTFHINRAKFARILIGADDELFYPTSEL